MSVVLLIDDEPAMGSLVDVWVSELGGRVVQVRNLADALEASRSEPVKAVLLDISLGGKDGLDYLPDLKRERSLADAPVIAFSIHDSREGEALRRGADAFVKKPFRSQDLQGALKDHLS
jgi:DNA-binding response OmpR family regulator